MTTFPSSNKDPAANTLSATNSPEEGTTEVASALECCHSTLTQHAWQLTILIDSALPSLAARSAWALSACILCSMTRFFATVYQPHEVSMNRKKLERYQITLTTVARAVVLQQSTTV